MTDIKDRNQTKNYIDGDDWLSGQEDSAGLGSEFKIKASDIAFPMASLMNFKVENYRNICKAIADVRAGAGVASYNSYNIWYMADSIGVGTGGNTAAGTSYGVNNAGGSMHFKSPIAKVSDLLTQRGVYSSFQSVWGAAYLGQLRYANAALTYNQWNYADSRIVTTGAWHTNTFVNPAPSGIALQTNAYAADTNLAFTPTNSAGGIITDALELYCVSYNNIPFSVTVGGAAVTGSPVATPDTTPNFYTKKAIVSKNLGAPANNTWVVGKDATATAGATVLLSGIKAINSLKPELSFCNIATGGTTLKYVADNSSNRFKLFTNTNNDTCKDDIANAVNSRSSLAIIQFGINDTAAGESFNSSFNTLDLFIKGLKAVNIDVLVVIPHSTYFDDPLAGGTVIKGQDVRNGLRKAAVLNNCAYVDIDRRWGSFSKLVGGPQANSSASFNYFYTKNSAVNGETDGITHPAPMGYYDYANAIMQFFVACGA